jgi:hypothetical protein
LWKNLLPGALLRIFLVVIEIEGRDEEPLLQVFEPGPLEGVADDLREILRVVIGADEPAEIADVVKAESSKILAPCSA